MAGGRGFAERRGLDLSGALRRGARFERLMGEQLRGPAQLADGLVRDKDIIPDALKSKTAPDRGLV